MVGYLLRIKVSSSIVCQVEGVSSNKKGVPCSKKKGKMGIPSYYHNHHIPSTTIIIENKCSAFCNPWTIKDCMQPSSTITYHHIPSHTITYNHIPSHTITYHHIPSHTIIYHHIPSHTITYLHRPSSTFMNLHRPS